MRPAVVYFNEHTRGLVTDLGESHDVRDVDTHKVIAVVPRYGVWFDNNVTHTTDDFNEAKRYADRQEHQS